MGNTRYCDFSAELATPIQRSVRINGLATCLRLEEIYWTILEALARQESVTVGKLLSRWALEMDLAHDIVRNFTGYVRVICVVQVLRKISCLSTDDLNRLSALLQTSHAD